MNSSKLTGNKVLNALSAAEYKKIGERLEKIEMKLGTVLYYPGEKIDYVYFPETSVISIVMVLENGDTVESGVIGKEGFSGAAVILSEEVSPQEATVQLTGEGFRLPIEDFKKLFDESNDFRNAALHSIYAFITQISQNAACLCHHKIENRLARWFLMFSDRSGRKDMEMTQEFISQMLGVHRPTVSKNANNLQKIGFISYNRGTVKIIDRAGLEKFACECYRAINQSLNGYENPRTFQKIMTN